MRDLLAQLPIHRQAAIIRRLVCRPAFERPEIPGIGRYRSPGDIRVLVAAETSTACPARRGFGKAMAPGPFKRPSRQRLYDCLVENFGPLCASCGESYGYVIDHDHIVGLVRGLVCLDCNQAVERCLHVDSAACRMASFLNEPPAFGLQVRYPARHRQRALDDVRQAILNFDPLDRRAWPSAIPAEWRWDVPPEAALSKVEKDWWRRHPNASELRGGPHEIWDQ